MWEFFCNFAYLFTPECINMKVTVREYRTIKLGETGHSGDAVANASDKVDAAIVRNNERLLEIDVTDRISYCLTEHEGISFGSHTFSREGDIVIDMLLFEGCSLLGWPKRTAIELKPRLMPDTIYQCEETIKRWEKARHKERLTYVIIGYGTMKGRKQKDGGIKVKPNIIYYNASDFFAFADGVIENHEKILTEREKRKIKRTRREYLNQLHDTREYLLKKAKSAFARGRVSLFLGAGVSIDAGLPKWQDLLKGVFENQNDKPYAYVSDANIEAILEACDNSNIVAGRYAFNGFDDGDKFKGRIKDVLYQEKKPSSGLVDAICDAIVDDAGEKIGNIVTYNYDDLIETRLDEKGYKEYNSVYGKNRNTSKRLQIYHVHGMIPQRGSIDSTPILSEKDYHDLYRNNHNWANVVQLYSMNTMTCFFIGLSLTDPNLRRLLDFSYSDEGPSKADINMCPHFAFLQRKMLKGDKRVKVNQEHWRVQERMLREFGINVIWYDKHEELPWLIRSIMVRKEEQNEQK